MFTLSLINPATQTPFFTRPTRNAVWSTTRTGDERLRAIIDDVSLSDAVALFDKATFAFVRISKNAEIAWQGVVTDVQLTYDNNKYALVITAVGYSFLFKNTHVTGVISDTGASKFFQVSSETFPQSVSDSRVSGQTLENLIVTFRSNSVFQANERVCFVYRCPDLSLYKIQHLKVKFSTLPFNFGFEIYGIDVPILGSVWTAAYTITNLAANVLHTVVLPNAYAGIIFAIRATANTTVPVNTTVWIDNIRLSTMPAPITPSKIISLRGINVINKAQQESDLLNVVVEDKTDAELLDLVCQQDRIEHVTLAPNVVELKTQTNLEHREKYRIVADTLNIARDATTIANNVYARCRDFVDNFTRRTPRADDPVARDVFAKGVFRDAVIDVDTNYVFEAVAKSQEALATMRSGSMRLRATTRNVATASQSPMPPWKVRAGAIAGIVNLGTIGYGQVSEVIIDRTDYDAATDTLTIESQIDAL